MEKECMPMQIHTHYDLGKPVWKQKKIDKWKNFENFWKISVFIV